MSEPAAKTRSELVRDRSGRIVGTATFNGRGRLIGMNSQKVNNSIRTVGARQESRKPKVLRNRR